jgi:hypothetical protein
LGTEWQGKAISLQLDHKDGDRCNNLLENLRILCPNCHSQTESFAGKRKRKAKPKFRKTICTSNCVFCNSDYEAKYKKQKYCSYECHKKSIRRAERPSKEQLMKELADSNFVQVGKKYGVSDNAIRKWLK